MMKKNVVALTAAGLLCSAGGVCAQTQGSTPKATPAPAAGASQAASTASSGTTPSSQPPAATPAAPVYRSIPIVVESVLGRARFQLTEDGPKTIATKGARLGEGTRVQLGPHTVVVLRVGDGQLLTFDHAGNFLITAAVNDGATDITRIKLDQGRVGFDVKRVRYANDVVIETPDMTLAVKGTEGVVEYTPGQPTRALGTETNTGRIEVTYLRTGQQFAMTRNERSDSAVQDPAVNYSRAAIVEGPTEAAREKDEKGLIKRTEGSAQSTILDLGDTNSAGMRINLNPMVNPGPTGSVGVPGTRSSLHLDTTSGLLFETIAPLDTSLLRQGLAFDPAAIDGGSAIVVDQDTGFRSFVYVQSTIVAGAARNEFTTLAIDSPITRPEPAGNIGSTGASAAPLIRGLGAIGDQLYASGRSSIGSDSIYSVDLSRLALAEVMNTGLEMEGAIGGVNERGTLMGFARDPDLGASGSILQRGVLLEMDPRNNYLAAVHTGLGADGHTLNPSSLDLSEVSAITGLGAGEDSVTLSAIVGSGVGRMALLRYEMSGGTPRLAEVRSAPDVLTSGMASETAAVPPTPVVLREPTGPIDMVALNARYAMMAYSQQALNSGVVERSLRKELLKGAVDPVACAASGALTALPTILARHVDERAGIGRTVSEFRTQLAPMHPCLPGMPMH